MRRKTTLLLSGLILGVLAFGPSPAQQRQLDRGMNGIWIGHQWYTGRHVETGEPVSDEERSALLRRLRDHGIRYAFVHAGPLLPDGTVRDRPGPWIQWLMAEAPDIEFLPWIGGDVRHLPLTTPSWRQSVVRTVAGLRAAGFRGVHLDIEPLRDRQPGYLALLHDLRHALGPDFFLSQATRRAGPFGIAAGPLGRWFWSGGFYRETMAVADQTVLMAYDTTLHQPWLYRSFVSHQTDLLAGWGCRDVRHRVLVGIPSFEDAPRISDPAVENIPNAVRGVRAALQDGESPPCFEGVALYADWVTSQAEWRQLQEEWNHPAAP